MNANALTNGQLLNIVLHWYEDTFVPTVWSVDRRSFETPILRIEVDGEEAVYGFETQVYEGKTWVGATEIVEDEFCEELQSLFDNEIPF